MVFKLVAFFLGSLLISGTSAGLVLSNENQLQQHQNEKLEGVNAKKFRRNEYKILDGHTKLEDYFSPLPHTYIDHETLPKHFYWGNVDGVNYLTKNLNQHIPQYCGSCWAHGSLSSLSDRVKIARKAKGIDINLSVQHILNCGFGIAGSCHGGSHTGVYDFIKNHAKSVPFDTCQGYEACSRDSTDGFCTNRNWECSTANTCRTCSTFEASGGFCKGLDHYPNVTIAEYGIVAGEKHMMAEIFARGPIPCVVDSDPLDEYTGGIIDNTTAKTINHIIAVVGWGQSKKGVKYWIVRNSWGEYWGEMGYFRVKRGENQMQIEKQCAWATPKTYTERNFPCFEDGTNC